MDFSVYPVPALYKILQGRNNSFRGPLTVSVPGSKSITNRALLLATLASGQSILRGALFSDDSRHFLKCVQSLGFEAVVREDACEITVTGLGGQIPKGEASLYVGSAGTAARFLTACLGVSKGIYHMDASGQMRRRPMAPLLSSLEELGCKITYQGERGFFPFTLCGDGFGKNSISIHIGHSSQFLSALLISSCLCPEDFSIQVEGSHGMAYIEMTCKMMEQFGVQVLQPKPGLFLTKKGQRYQALDYRIEPDVSAACYFYALAPLLGIPVITSHVHFHSLQGDVAFLKILEQMGCGVKDTEDGILVTPPDQGIFHGIKADMSACSDQAITLAAIAPFADGPTTITGIGHIRFQECDRMRAICTELGRMGIRCREDQDSITIWPGTPKPALIHTYDDHRMAMGFTLTGLRSEGVVIDNPGCCRKTFETYFQVLDQVIRQLAAD